jgi:hypothetical protein
MMNIDIFLLISFLLPFVMMGGLFYFIVVRKNNFEERVAHYIPYHSLDSERRQYIEKVEKYKRYICIGLKVFFSFSLILSVSLLLFAINSKQGSAPEIMPQRLLTLISIPVVFTFLLYYIFSYVVRKNAKAQRLLLEEMEKSDFQHLLEVQKNLPLLRKYFPFFIVSKEKLYFFTFFTIRELDPKRIVKVRWWRSKGGNRTVFIKHSGWSVIGLPQMVYGHLQTSIRKYNPKADIEP